MEKLLYNVLFNYTVVHTHPADTTGFTSTFLISYGISPIYVLGKNTWLRVGYSPFNIY